MTIFVSICVATYKRPKELSNLLSGLDNLRFDKMETPSIEVVVVDNDSSGSAKEICEQLKTHFRWTLIYDIEPQQGVSYARNRTVACASDISDFLVFIDDDEVPEPQWLDELLASQFKFGADVVSAPVYPRFQDDAVPQWIREGCFFEPPHRKTGASLDAAFTNNVLVKAELIRQLDVVFDPRFAIKGSEDTHLFMRLRKAGAKIVWTNEAIVFESIPSNRTTLDWLLKRGFWGWSSYSLFEKELFPSPTVQLSRLIKGLGLIATGLLATLPSLFLGRHRLYKAILSISQGIGTLSGLLGLQDDW
jgi:GT2 family glycosyltransferase